MKDHFKWFKNDQLLYLHLTAVIGNNEAQQDERWQTDDWFERKGVDGALEEKHMKKYSQ